MFADEYCKIYGSSSSHAQHNAPAESSSSTSSSTQLPSQPLVQQSLQQLLEKKKLWDINDSRAKRYHYLIGEMIAVDNEPLSIVDHHVGFKRLINNALPQYTIPGRTYFTEKIIPDMYERVVSKLKNELERAEAIAFTSDLWTSSVNNAAFLSFTGHWISENFKLNHAVLNMAHFPESHTSENIKRELLQCVTKWDIPITKIQAIVHDNGANMVKGVKETLLPSQRCFIHTLQLVINNALDNSSPIKAILTSARRIVTHFNHSGYTKLESIQSELGLPNHKLIQDIQTRWNSTYYLLERLSEQKRAISVYISESRSVNFENLTSDQWEVIEHLLKLLKPFEEITKITSSTYAPISDVIPSTVALIRYLMKDALIQQTAHVDDFRKALIENMEARFNLDDLCFTKTYYLSTFLDPRYKNFYFDATQVERIRRAALREGLRLSLDDENDDSDPETASKRSRLDNESEHDSETHKLFWACFEESSIEQPTEEQPKNATAEEIANYIALAKADRKINPYEWWALSTNKNRFPILSKLAKRYLITPASSVYSERLFSEAGLIYEEKRNRLAPERAEKIVFLHHNLPLLDFKY